LGWAQCKRGVYVAPAPNNGSQSQTKVGMISVEGEEGNIKGGKKCWERRIDEIKTTTSQGAVVGGETSRRGGGI